MANTAPDTVFNMSFDDLVKQVAENGGAGTASQAPAPAPAPAPVPEDSFEAMVAQAQAASANVPAPAPSVSGTAKAPETVPEDSFEAMLARAQAGASLAAPEPEPAKEEPAKEEPKPELVKEEPKPEPVKEEPKPEPASGVEGAMNPPEEPVKEEKADKDKPAKEKPKRSRSKKKDAPDTVEAPEPPEDRTESYRVDVFGDKPKESLSMDVLFTKEEVAAFRQMLQVFVRTELKMAMVGAMKELLHDFAGNANE